MSWFRVPQGDTLKVVAAACALVATASAEYELARAVGMHPWVAASVPGALDAYVLRALRAHREVLTSVLAMVAVNAASHLVSTGLLPLDWRLVTAVSAIAPLVLWRVHALGTPGEWRERKLWELPKRARTDEHTEPPFRSEHRDEHGNVIGYSTPGTGSVPEPSTDGELCFCGATVWGDIGAHQRAPGHVPEPCTPRDTCVHGHIECDGHGGECIIYTHPSTFEEHAEEAVTVASTDGPWTGTHPFPYEWDEHDTVTPVLRLVPDPVPASTITATDVRAHLNTSTSTSTSTSTPSTPSTDQEHVSTGVLHPSDTAHMERARVLAGQSTGTPTVRALKTELGVGTPRAQRLCAALAAEHARAREGSTS